MNTGKKEPLMATKLNHEQKGILDDQLFALRDKTVDGVRDFDYVRKGLQDIIEGKFLVVTPVVAMPSWYVAPYFQLERAFQANSQQSWGFVQADFPSVPEDTTKLWLLVVNLPGSAEQEGLQRTFDAKWNVIVPPSGYTKYRDVEFKSDPDHLRLAPGQTFTPGIYWVEFDPDAYQGLSPEAALKQSTIDGVTPAGLAVLDAVWQFPDWSLDWFKNGKPAPNLTGLQFRWDKKTDCSIVPLLRRWGDDRQLELIACWADDDRPYWASPSVSGVLI